MSAVSEIMSRGLASIDLSPGTSALDVASTMVRDRTGAIIAERYLLKK